MSPLLAPSRRQLVTHLDALLEKEPEARILGVRSPIRRPWPETLERRGRRFRVAWCETELEVREALSALEEHDNERVLLVTPLGDGQLGADVVARLPRARLVTASRWDALRTAFRARDLDPRLRGMEWLCDLLIERTTAMDYPPAAGGVLDLDTAWRNCLEHVVGLPHARADVDALLAWTAGDGNLARFDALPAVARDHLLGQLAASGGAAAALVTEAVSARRGSDALAIGLVCSVIFSADDARGALREAAVRLEPMLGDARIVPEAGRALAEAARRVAGRLDQAAMLRHQTRAAAILEAVRAADHAELSASLLVGFEARLKAAARAIDAATASGSAPDLALVAGLVRNALAHDQAADQRPRFDRLQMAARVCRWLSDRQRHSPAFGSAARAYAEDGGFADWARQSLGGGDSEQSIASTYAKLRNQASERRDSENRIFAELLRDWNAGGSAGDEALPIERALEMVVAPLAAHAPVLLLVLDGLSFAVARPLVADMARLGWTELAPAGRTSSPPLVAALPTVTEVSRASLLSGRLSRGDAAAERAAFSAHPRLREVSRAGKPPLLFHKSDLGAGPELEERVQSAVADANQRVVGVVHNAVDAQLAGSDQLEVPWSAEGLRQLTPLLRTAREASRIVAMTGDHGHVLEAGTTQTQGAPGDRWRAGGSARDGEVELRGGRVLSPDGTRGAVLAWSERLRYSAKRNGYHGGASPQEVLVPLVVLTSGAAPPDWVEAPPAEPAWWREKQVAPSATIRLPPVSVKRLDKRQPDLFEAAPPSDAWIDALLGSMTYAAQRGLAGRGAPDDAVVRALVAALATRGGRLSRTALAQMLGLPAFRTAGLVNAARRVLNVDQAQVLSIDSSADEVVLDLRLLRLQFDLGEQS